MQGQSATGDQVTQAINNAQETVASLQSQQSQLNQDLIIAIANGDTGLATYIQGQITIINGQLIYGEQQPGGCDSCGPSGPGDSYQYGCHGHEYGNHRAEHCLHRGCRHEPGIHIRGRHGCRYADDGTDWITNWRSISGDSQCTECYQ